ncbi:type II toxin-antitoxin system RelE/ParE family toxin [Aquimarina algiphila]|uniref:Type II toxin-antitoxin system RelE/ParE family toxin n=1 Tax=Aquimarina algiphila TaxID=2047982 RepID=A0A554VID5_9FLAO|nr:type II toxin-antitoxin system RelE/ParE family toxin [Aquimarina algiphila]TSE07415.1 type II toxin-antitoxin system RelE/ParE family toxin [Aquimarina algiphila]
MKSYIVQIKPSAELDITTRYHQIKESSEQDAINWYLTIIKTIESLDQLAERCPSAPESEHVAQDIRHLIIGHYRVLFSIEETNVHILHVRHSAMSREQSL